MEGEFQNVKVRIELGRIESVYTNLYITFMALVIFGCGKLFICFVCEISF